MSITKDPPVNLPAAMFKEPAFNIIVPLCAPVGFVPFQVITELVTSALFKSATVVTFTASLVDTFSFFSLLHAVKTDAINANDKITFFILV